MSGWLAPGLGSGGGGGEDGDPWDPIREPLPDPVAPIYDPDDDSQIEFGELSLGGVVAQLKADPILAIGAAGLAVLAVVIRA
jgi:hypothetical protein